MIARFRRRFARCERGVAAVEFAIAAPFLILLLFGAFEVSRFLIIQQRVEKIAFSLADITAQYDPREGQINIDQVFAALEHIVKSRFSTTGTGFDANGRIYLSSVRRPENVATPKVQWQCRDGALNQASQVGQVNQNAALPRNFAIEERDNIIVSEVYYRFTPLFRTVFTGPFTIYRTALFRPRLGELTASPSSGENACAQ